MRTCCIAQGTLLRAVNAQSVPKWEGNPKKSRCTYIYSWVTLLSSGN